MRAIVEHKRGVTATIIILMFWPAVYIAIKSLFKVGELMVP